MGWKQARKCPGSRPGRHGGRLSRQEDVALGHRGAKGHPLGRARREGTFPGMLFREAGSAWRLGLDSSNPQV